MQFVKLGELFKSGENGEKGEFVSNLLSMIDFSKKSKNEDLLNKLFAVDSQTNQSSYSIEDIKLKAKALKLNNNDLNLVLSKASDATFFDRAKIGTLTWNDAIKDTRNSVNDLASELKNINVINKDTFDTISNTTDVKQQRQMLQGYVDGVDGLGTSLIELGEEGTQATGFFGTLGNAAKGFLATLTSMLPLIIAVGTAFAAWKIFEYSQTGFTRATEKMNDTVSEYEDASSKLDSLNSELDETKSRISELQGLSDKGIITFDEEIELEKLQSTNNELERQVELQKDLVRTRKEAAVVSTRKAANTEQSYYEYNKEKYGFWGGLFYTLAGTQSHSGTTEDTTAAQEWKKQNKGDTTIAGQLQGNLDLLKKQQQELKDYETENYKQQGTEAFTKKQKKLKDQIDETKEAIASQSETVQNYIDQLTDVDTGMAFDKSDEQTILGYKNLLDEWAHFGETSNEKNLSKLNNFFSTSFGSDLKKSFTEIIKNGGNATDVLKEFKKTGLTVKDIGVNKSSFLRYFDDIVRQSKEATSAIEDYSATVSDVEKATESSDQDKDWSTISSAYKTAKELLKEGKTGSDDFQSVAGFLNPKGIKTYMEQNGKYSADAYQKAFEDAMATANRWFGEDEAVSMKNFVNDFKKKGLFSVTTDATGLWDITANFKTSAEAANAFGMSVESVETMLDALKAYGYEDSFKDIKYSTENIKEYKNALEGLEKVYNSLEDGDSKKRLENLLKGYDLGSTHIEGFEEELEKYKDDLDNIPEEKILRIKLEYDLSSIQLQIDQLQGKADEGGDTQTWAELNYSKRQYVEKSEGRSGNEFLNIDEYQASKKLVDNLRNELANVTESEQKEQIQRQISNIYDAQKSINDAFADSGLSWNDFTSTDGYQDALNDLVSKSSVAADDITDLLGHDVNVTYEVDVDTSSAESKIDGIFDKKDNVITMEVEATTDQIQKQLDNLQAGQTLIFTASVDGVEQGIKAVKNEDGTITYTAKYDDVDVPLDVIEKDGKVTYHADTKNLPTTLPPIYRQVVYKEIGNNAGKATANIIKNATSNIIGGGSASGTMLSVAKSDGTAYNVLNTVPISKAHASGKVGLETDQRALVNEEEINGHSESIVRDGIWRLIPGGAHLENLKKGDIIFSAQQTEDLLKHGKTPGHATRAYASGTISKTALTPAYRLGNTTTSTASSKSSSSTSSSTSSDTSSSTEETLDEIEIKIKRIERDISNLDSTAQAAYKSWTERNSALISEISNVRSEIDLQQQAYNRYMQEAESVGLSYDWASKIREGRIEIEKITDEDLKKKIDLYQQWYEKALDCSDAIIKLKDNLADLAKQRFDNVKKEYDNLISGLEHRQKMIENTAKKIETEGYLVSVQMYEALAKSQRESISALEKQYAQLNTTLTTSMEEGKIEKFSESWYELVGEIQDVESAILDMNTSLIETNNTIRKTQWDLFDKMQELLSDITSEKDFLVELMSNENMFDKDTAAITDQGKATLGLYAVAYNTYMNQVNDYAEQIKKINAEIANDPNNNTLLDRRRELIESQRELIKNANSEKQSMKSLVKDGYDALLDVMDKLIDKRKEALSTTKDLYDYEKNIREQTENIASLEKQLKAYQGDDSEFGKNTIQKIQVQLKAAKENLQETEYEKYIENSEKMLDNFKDNTQEFLNSRLDNLDGLVKGVIESTNANADEIKKTLISETASVGTTISEDMDAIWSTNGTYTSVVTSYSEEFKTKLTTTNTILESIRKYLAAMSGASDEEAKNELDSISKNESNIGSETVPTPAPSTPSTSDTSTSGTGDGTPTVGDAVTFTNGRYYYSSDGISPSGKKNLGGTVYITKINTKSWATKPYHISTGSTLGNGDLGWVSLDQLKGYRTGGLVDETGLAMLHGTKQHPELVLNAHDTDNLLDVVDIAKMITDGIIKMNDIPVPDFSDSPIFKKFKETMEINNNQTVNVGDINIGDIRMDGVNDPEEFAHNLKEQLVKNPQIQKIIQEETIGQMLGNNSMKKYIY